MHDLLCFPPDNSKYKAEIVGDTKVLEMSGGT